MNDELDYIVRDNEIYALGEDGVRLCEIKWTEVDGVANIYRTFVDKNLGGRGIAGRLVQIAVDEIEGKSLVMGATCSYAQSWLQRHKGIEPSQQPRCTPKVAMRRLGNKKGQAQRLTSRNRGGM